jgi:hypothetical protein
MKDGGFASRLYLESAADAVSYNIWLKICFVKNEIVVSQPIPSDL